MTGNREALLDAAFGFIESAIECPGVLGVALIGSIISSKKSPKDIDLVLYIASGADLTLLAGLARRLKGRLQGLNLGADAFLASADRKYLGRLCSWKDCRPGVRAACDALHCGRRPYLHDDLGAVTLAAALVANPPVEVWPRSILRRRIATDLERMVARFQERHSSPLNPTHSVVTALAHGGKRRAAGRAG